MTRPKEFSDIDRDIIEYDHSYIKIFIGIPKPVWAVGFAHEQTLRDATLVVFSFLILKRLQHIILIGIVGTICYYCSNYFSLPNIFVTEKIVAQKISTDKTSGIKFAKIQDIQVGERAIGTNPEVYRSRYGR
jgi:hypothetical protein